MYELGGKKELQKSLISVSKRILIDLIDGIDVKGAASASIDISACRHAFKPQTLSSTLVE
jgi:hypothetical protein